MKKKILFPILFAAVALPLSMSSRSNGLNAQFVGEYNDRSIYVQYASVINSQLADEGFTLLKNDGTLPMDLEGAKVSLVGRSSFDVLRGGSGSGAGSVARGVTAEDIESSLKAVGAEVNQTLKTFYSNTSKSGPGRSNGNDNWKGNSQVQIGETPLDAYGDAELSSMDEYNELAIQVITREGSEGCDVKAIDARDFDPRSGKSLPSGWEWDEITDKHALELTDNEQDLFDELHKHFEHIVIIVNSSNIIECGQFQNDPKVAGVLWIGNPGDVGPGAIGRILSGAVNPSGHTVDTWMADFKKDPTYQNFSDNSQTSGETFKYTSTGSNDDCAYFSKTDNYASQDTMFNADGTPTRSYGTDKSYNDTSKPRWLDEDTAVVKYGINGVKASAYVSYEEGIYFDYRYYETKYDDMKAAGQDADSWYNGVEGVVYPFGYGLSYTTFEQKIVSSNVSNKVIKNGNVKVEVKVKVKNTGDVAGKEVVQLYWNAPYIKGGIEKASKVLCAFDKTDLLEPGEDQTLTLNFYTQDVADYDFMDANNNGFAGYELDGGDYRIVLGKNAHEELDEVKFQIAQGGIKYQNDRYTGHEVKNRFTDRGFYSSLPSEDDFEFTQFSREDMEDTFPTHPTIEDRTLGANSRMEEFFMHEFTLKEVEVDQSFEYVPEEVYKSKEDIQALDWEQGNGSTDVKFTDLLNTDIDDPRWKDFMDQLTYDEMLEYVYGPRSHNTDISRLNKPSTSDSDGPQRFKIMWWVSGPIVAATYNVDLAKKQGECVGMEAHIEGTYGWAGPGVNIHRSPFGGRNFEYYSADPFLTGRMAGRVVGGASDRGVYCFFKHFVVNDQEKNRESVSTFVTEQALRQIYLRAFQLVIQEGKSTGLMSSYNRLGLMETAASYPLLTEVLRDEWGFKGSIISDMTHSGNGSVNFKCYENINNRVLSGCDQQLDNGGGFKDLIDAKWDSTKGCPVLKSDSSVEAYSWWYALRTNAQRVIWMCARCGTNSKTFIPPVDAELSNVVRGVFEAEVGDDIEIKVTLPDELSSAEMEIDPFTPLPDGLSFDGEKITGSVTKSVNKFIHILVTDGNNISGISFELRIYAKEVEVEMEDMPITPEVEPQPEKKKGCFGTIEVTLTCVALLGALAAGFMFFNKKRRIHA